MAGAPCQGLGLWNGIDLSPNADFVKPSDLGLITVLTPVKLIRARNEKTSKEQERAEIPPSGTTYRITQSIELLLLFRCWN